MEKIRRGCLVSKEDLWDLILAKSIKYRDYPQSYYQSASNKDLQLIFNIEVDCFLEWVAGQVLKRVFYNSTKIECIVFSDNNEIKISSKTKEKRFLSIKYCSKTKSFLVSKSVNYFFIPETFDVDDLVIQLIRVNNLYLKLNK